MALRAIKSIKFSSLVQVQRFKHDYHNDVPDGNTQIHYLCPSTSKEIAFLSYRPHNGQLGILTIHDEFHRKKELGTAIVNDVINKVKMTGTKEVWAVSYTTTGFWKSLGFSPRNPVHSSVSSQGYFKSI